MMQLTALQDDEKTPTVVSIEANLVNTYSNSDPSSSLIAIENRDLPRAFQVWRCAPLVNAAPLDISKMIETEP